MQNDAEKLVTTKDLAEAKDELKAEMAAMNRRMDRFEEKLTKTDQTVERMAIRIVQMEQAMETKADAQRRYDGIMNVLDKIMKRFDIYDSERAAGEYTFRQHEAKIENHEKRLLLLEQKA